MWIHWVSTYMVDPENWVGQMYDSQFHGTWKASAWYKNPKVDELLRKARGLIEQSRAGAALRGGDQADRRRLPGYLDLQHDRACRHVEPGQGRALLPGRQRLRGALDEPVGIEPRGAMLRFVLRRVLTAIPSLLGLLVITFLLIRVVPADPAAALAGDNATPQQIAAIRHQYGFDRPIAEQLLLYLGQVLRFDFGESQYSHRPVGLDLRSGCRPRWS